MNNVVDFKLTIPIEKAEQTDDGWYITGLAAGAEPDQEGDEFLPQAIQFLADQINGGGIPLRAQHVVDTITEDIGELVKAFVTEDHKLYVRAKLDKVNPNARYLWEKLDEGKQFGLSVKGASVGYTYGISKATGKRVRQHPLVLINELSVTTRPVFTPSLGTVIRKAIELANEEEEMETTTGETETTQSSAPETNVSTQTPSPSDELVKSLMTNPDFTALIEKAVSAAIPTQQTVVVETPKNDTTEVETSSQPDVAEIVKSAVSEVSQSFDAKLQALLERIPASGGPAVLEKSERQELIETFAELSPSARLRASLAGMHGEQEKYRG